MATHAPQSSATKGVQVATEPRCAICKSAHRGAIEDCLVDRRDGVVGDDGHKLTGNHIVARSVEWWGIQVSLSSLNNHFSKHFRPRAAAGATVQAERVRGELERRVQSGDIDSVSHRSYQRIA